MESPEQTTTTKARFNRKRKKIFDISMVFGYFSVMIPLIVLCHSEKNGPELPVTFLIWILSLLVGTLIGMIYSPFSEEEKTNFNTLSTVMVSFLTGYLTSKLLDPILAILAGNPNFTETIEFYRLIIFVVGVLFATISVYIYRKYYLQGKDVVYTDEKKVKN